nr:uncharacterized mitochondrial protein AtMg00810-like [Tanacetum cinerariifolium]
MVEKSKLDEDLHGKPLDATLYHGMIGSLMYLTSGRPDLIYVVCLCARYQAKPTEKYLNAVKRIFRCLKGTIKMGLWYSNDTGGYDSTRLKKLYKKTRRKLHFDAKEPVRLDKSKVECFNSYNTRHFDRECRSKGNQDSIDWNGHAKDKTDDYALMAFNSSNSGSDTEKLETNNSSSIRELSPVKRGCRWDIPLESNLVREVVWNMSTVIAKLVETTNRVKNESSGKAYDMTLNFQRVPCIMHVHEHEQLEHEPETYTIVIGKTNYAGENNRSEASRV